MRVIVVGGGIMGLSTAWALCRAGHEPVLYEQGPIPNPLASSCDEHRLTRFTYGALTGYARMVHEAHAAWERLFADLGRSHLRPTGTLVIADADDGWVAAARHGLEDLGRWLARGAWPCMTTAGSPRSMSTGRRSAWPTAAPIAAMRWWSPPAPGRRTSCRRCGAGSRRRGRSRSTSSRPRTRCRSGARRPRYSISSAARGGFYAVPPVDGTRLKVGDHVFSLRGHPDLERAATDADRVQPLAVAESRLVGFARYRVLEAKTCFYSVAEGERFVVERARAWLLAGFSGHGFKFGAVIGEAIAEALAGRRPEATVSAWAAGSA